MRNFYTYITDRSLASQKQRIAYLMAEHRIDPYLYIEQFLDSDQFLTEEWLGGFFKKLGNAWRAFWQKPGQQEDSPLTRLETAKKAMGELEQMIKQNVGTKQNTLQVVLRGLEQSLAILQRIEPTIQQYDQHMMQYQKTGVPHSGSDDELPPKWQQKYMAIFKEMNWLMRQPQTDEVANKLAEINDKFVRFFGELEDYITTLNDPDEKKQIVNFLDRKFNDTTFREIMDLLKEPRVRQKTKSVNQYAPQIDPKSYFGSLGTISAQHPQLGKINY
jgi:hypothetical protein